MTIELIIEALKANIDKTVKITYGDGDTDLAIVLKVDDEGFVFDLASLRPEERKTEYWTPFTDLAEVTPVDD